ncbi:MAG: hypothetical protein F6K63_12180 [Moorea sp. SIO1G6]|uniref:hypothetical protein n=1 Tax=Moorena sp. SIO1G6 TaxID=2607840 RepID=UPI0013BF3F41|nr:hypothetical protein [Moorena sp. SIO1G6]NET65098.1 hypothetical protein [Moorena sp. SIO1G6]
MSNYTWEYIQKHPKPTKRLLGINYYEQLIKLIEQGNLIAKKKQEENEKNKIRLIKAGGGNHPKLSEE